MPISSYTTDSEISAYHTGHYYLSIHLLLPPFLHL